jgi:hypothetical protein
VALGRSFKGFLGELYLLFVGLCDQEESDRYFERVQVPSLVGHVVGRSREAL